VSLTWKTSLFITMRSDENNMSRLRIAFQTMKDYWKMSIILTLIFIGIVVMYSAVYPAFKENLQGLASTLGMKFSFIRGLEYMTTYPGFLNMELYQIFWILILGMLIGFLASSLLSKEIEAKTIDLLMSNPVSRKQIILEKYLGLIPFILLINFTTLLTVYGLTVAIGEQINLGNLIMTHAISIPYFLAIAAVGLLISVIIDEKIKASIITIAIIIGMYIFESISLLIPDYKSIGYLSLTYFYNPADILIKGIVDIYGVLVLIIFIIISLIISMIYFDHKDIAIS
jgi:beta-exotoxin I transport system permease protein